MGRLRLGVAAAALAVAADIAVPALADEPRASVEGVQDKSLRQAIQQYIGTTKRAPHGRFEARQRAQGAAEDAVVVLRSEGYYDYSVTPDISGSDKPRPVLHIDPGLVASADVGRH